MIQVLPSRSARSANLRQNTSCSGTPVAWQTIDLKQRPTFASCSHRSGLRQIRDFSVNAICGHVVISRRLTILRPQLGQSVTSGQHAFGRLEAVLRQGSRSRRLAVEVRSADSGVKQWKRYSRYKAWSEEHNMKVSWERYHLSILFVDRTDTVRARIAAGLFDRIANWNGFGRALYPTSAGIEVSGKSPDISLSVGLMSQAGLLKIPPKLFSRPGEAFELEDFDRNDFILAVDKQTKDEIDKQLCAGVPDCKETLSKVALLTDFKGYLEADTLRQQGGSAILESELRQIIEPVLDDAQKAQEIVRPSLTHGSEEWNRMVQYTVCSCAGLTQFLIDAWPPDLPDYDPL